MLSSVFMNKIIYFLLLLPTLLINYFTLSIIDSDNNLSAFTTLFVFVFNFFNISLAYALFKRGLKKTVIYFFTLIFCVLFIDTLILKLSNNNSIQIYDEELGWILNNSISLKINGTTKQNKKYIINYTTSDVKGFREYDLKKKYKKNILIIGDSFTAGPFASNNQMYYNFIREELENENIYYNWYVSGGGGYGTLQQFFLIKNYFHKISPDVIIHQFCENDFENNTKIIEKNSILKNQYYFRPYIDNGKISYDATTTGKIYRFFYRNSFLFKKIDNLITNYFYKKNNSYFNKQNYEKNFLESVKTTSEIFKIIKNYIPDNVYYVSINCSSKDKSKYNLWQKILEELNIKTLTNPNSILNSAANNGEDIFFSDGSHLNNYGNKLFGKSIGIELVKILSSKSLSN